MKSALIICNGPTCSGKSTLNKFFCERNDFIRIHPSDFFQNNIIVSDDIFYEKISSKLNYLIELKKNIILEGFPRDNNSKLSLRKYHSNKKIQIRYIRIESSFLLRIKFFFKRKRNNLFNFIYREFKYNLIEKKLNRNDLIFENKFSKNCKLEYEYYLNIVLKRERYSSSFDESEY